MVLRGSCAYDSQRPRGRWGNVRRPPYRAATQRAITDPAVLYNRRVTTYLKIMNKIKENLVNLVATNRVVQLVLLAAVLALLALVLEVIGTIVSFIGHIMAVLVVVAIVLAFFTFVFCVMRWVYRHLNK